VLSRTIPLGILLVSALLLSGCAPGETEVDASPNPATSDEAPVDQSPSGDNEEESLLLAVETSYQLWLSDGMTEVVTSAGDDYILSYAPGEEFVAGLYNVGLDDIIPIEQPELFTVYSAWLMLQDPATEITENGNLLTLNNEAYGNFVVTVIDGLIVSGEDVFGSWSGEFSYEPDAAVLARLAELLASE